ncbi:MAG: ABC transporter substrate-binding protein [Treponema sp.]|nr:ABC transporter substrate-binding protein [Treponema sp.]
MNKRVSVVMLGVVCLSALIYAGCTKKVAAPAGPAATVKAKKITLYQRKAELNDRFEELAQIYEKETGVEVEVLGASSDSYITSIQGKLTGKQDLTIFTIRTGVETEQLKAYLADMSGEPYLKNINPGMELIVDGKVVGIPYGIEGYGFMYNKNMVQPETITNLEGFRATLAALKSQGLDPFELSDKGFMLIGHILNNPFAVQDDPLGFIARLNKGEVKMADTPAFKEWAEYMAVIKEYCANPMETTYDQQIANFATGKTAMINQGNWTWAMFEDYPLDFEIGIAPMPLAGNAKIAVGVPNYFAVNSQGTPEEIEAGKDFIEWLFTSDVGKEYIVNKLYLVPAMSTIDVGNNLDPISKIVLEETRKGNSLMWTYNYWPNNIVNNFLVPAAQDFFLNKAMTGQQFLENLDKAWVQAN